MPEPGSSRLEDLQMRWQQDPSSRVYLQLAEEYRKLGRLPEAVEVLKRGLEQRPNDLSGQVALGRCQLELDELEPALATLETVIERDPAHIVGNKLLLEAYLKTGDATRAGERLDLCKLLNPADPELDELEAQVRGLRSETPTPPPAPGVVPEPQGVTTAEIPIVPRAAAEAPAPPELEVIEELPAEQLEELPAEELEELPAEDVFEISPDQESMLETPFAETALEDAPTKPVLEPAGEPAAGEPAAEEPAAGEPAAGEPAVEEPPARDPAFETSPALGLAPEPALPEPAVDDSAFELVADEEVLEEDFELEAASEEIEAPAEPEAPEPWTALETPLPVGTLFDLGPPPPAPRLEELWGWPVVETVVPEPEELALAEAEDTTFDLEEPWVAPEPAVPEPAAPEPEPAAPEPAAPEPAAPEPAAPEPAAPEPAAPEPAAPAEKPATVTLGELYLRQGHTEEAEKIFRQVLRRDPRNAAALAGLTRVRGEEGLSAQELLASAGERIPVGLTAKKIRLLESYLKHLRRGEAHVR